MEIDQRLLQQCNQQDMPKMKLVVVLVKGDLWRSWRHRKDLIHHQVLGEGEVTAVMMIMIRMLEEKPWAMVIIISSSSTSIVINQIGTAAAAPLDMGIIHAAVVVVMVITNHPNHLIIIINIGAQEEGQEQHQQ